MVTVNIHGWHERLTCLLDCFLRAAIRPLVRPPARTFARLSARARQTTHRYAQRAVGICIHGTRHIHVVAGHPGEGASQVHDKGKRHPRDIVAASVASVVHEHFDKRISHLPSTVASPFYFPARPSAQPSVHLSARPPVRPPVPSPAHPPDRTPDHRTPRGFGHHLRDEIAMLMRPIPSISPHRDSRSNGEQMKHVCHCSQIKIR